MNFCFYNSISADELFAKAFRSLEIFLSVSSHLYRKLFSSLELQFIFDDEVTSVHSFVADFDFLICKSLRLRVILSNFN